VDTPDLARAGLPIILVTSLAAFPVGLLITRGRIRSRQADAALAAGLLCAFTLLIATGASYDDYYTPAKITYWSRAEPFTRSVTVAAGGLIGVSCLLLLRGPGTDRRCVGWVTGGLGGLALVLAYVLLLASH
jgi:hypothetical protein